MYSTFKSIARMSKFFVILEHLIQLFDISTKLFLQSCHLENWQNQEKLGKLKLENREKSEKN